MQVQFLSSLLKIKKLTSGNKQIIYSEENRIL